MRQTLLRATLTSLALAACTPVSSVNLPPVDASADAPGTDAPGTDAPGTDAPGTDAPLRGRRPGRSRRAGGGRTTCRRGWTFRDLDDVPPAADAPVVDRRRAPEGDTSPAIGRRRRLGVHRRRGVRARHPLPRSGVRPAGDVHHLAHVPGAALQHLARRVRRLRARRRLPQRTGLPPQRLRARAALLPLQPRVLGPQPGVQPDADAVRRLRGRQRLRRGAVLRAGLHLHPAALRAQRHELRRHRHPAHLRHPRRVGVLVALRERADLPRGAMPGRGVHPRRHPLRDGRQPRDLRPRRRGMERLSLRGPSVVLRGTLRRLDLQPRRLGLQRRHHQGGVQP